MTVYADHHLHSPVGGRRKRGVENVHHKVFHHTYTPPRDLNNILEGDGMGEDGLNQYQ